MNDPEARGSATDLLTKAQAYADIQRYDLAEERLREGLALQPEDALLHQELGRMLVAQQRWKAARSQLKRALALAPDNAEAHALMASVELEENHFHTAEQSILEALRLEPTSSYLYETYGRILYATGHLEKSERLLKKALELNPESESAHSMLAILNSEEKRSEAALAHGNQGLGLAPNADRTHLAMGLSYIQAGHPFRARQHLREAVRIDPTDADIREIYIEADRYCRVIYLPYYYYGLVIDRLPGRQFALWGVFVALIIFLPKAGVPDNWVLPITMGYFALCVYTWIATPLVKTWTRFFPAK